MADFTSIENIFWKDTYSSDFDTNEEILNGEIWESLIDAQKYVQQCYNLAIEENFSVFRINLENFSPIIRTKIMEHIMHKFRNVAKIIPLYTEEYLKFMNEAELYRLWSRLPTTYIDANDYIYDVALDEEHIFRASEITSNGTLKFY